MQMARRILPEPVAFPRLDEVPFDTDRKRLSTLHQTPQGLTSIRKGRWRRSCRAAMQCRWAQPCSPSQGAPGAISARPGTPGGSGPESPGAAYRLVPEGYDPSWLEERLTLLGLVGLEDPPRPEVPAAIQHCKNAGIKVIMITGDHPQTAKAIAREIGLVQSDTPVLITGRTSGASLIPSCNCSWTRRRSFLPAWAPTRSCALSCLAAQSRRGRDWRRGE